MSKIKYSYDYGESKLRGKNGSKGKFFVILFAVLLLIAVAVFVKSAFFSNNEDSAEVKVEEVVSEKTTESPTVTPTANQNSTTSNTASSNTNSAEAKTTVANPQGYDEDFAALSKAMEETDYQTSKKIALEMLKKYGESDKSGPYFRKIAHFITKLNMKIISNGLNDEKMVTHRIDFGDNLSAIAIKYNFPVEAILKANNLKSTKIFPGNTLKVYTFDWRIEVSKKARLLYVYDGDTLFAIYDIGIGKEGRTPEGEFKITDKIANPDWYSPDGRIVPFGDKENVLGTRWFKLEPINDTASYHIGYGIHGTWDTGSITKSLSNGCIRMRNEEVEELFTYIPRQVLVKIY